MKTVLKFYGWDAVNPSRERARRFEQFLTVLDNAGLAPDIFRFGDGPEADPCAREAFLVRLAEGRRSDLPTLGRRTDPAYDVSLGITGVSEQVTRLVFADVTAGRRPELFTLGSALAGVLHPAFGGLGYGAEPAPLDRMLAMTGSELRRHGLDGLAVRSWFGPDLMAVLDPCPLEAEGVVLTPTAWGGLEVDLVPDPWLAAPGVLADAKTRLDGALRAQGLLGEYGHPLLKKAAPGWDRVTSRL